MRRILPALGLLLISCSSTPSPVATAPAVDPALAVEAVIVTPAEPAPKQVPEVAVEAQRFARWLGGEMSLKERAAYFAHCEAPDTADPFCYSVKNRDKWQELRTAGRGRKSGKSENARARFVRGKLTNWKQLRYASVSDVLRGLKLATDPQVDALRLMALKEPLCPNSAAVALAAHSEKDLPDSALAATLGSLYEKGASCLSDKSEDRDVLLTRGGLLYVLAGKPTEALKLFRDLTSQRRPGSPQSFYWTARLEEKHGDPVRAAAIRQRLSEKYPFAFHSVLSQISQGTDPGSNPLTEPSFRPLTRSKTSEPVNRLLDQVEHLQRYGHTKAEEQVLAWAMVAAEAAEPELKLYLAELQDDPSAYLSNWKLLARLFSDRPDLISRKALELYFPKAHFPIFTKRSSGLDPYLLLSIARQESAFNERARSGANARGLLQILPSTSRLIEAGTELRLFDPDTNVMVGARYFSSLLDRMNGQLHLALAGYNAGPNRISTWLRRYPTEDSILFIDLIPFRETRHYVASILRNYYWYRRVHAPPTGNQLWVLDTLRPGGIVSGKSDFVRDIN